jgi:hypothetical protein
MMGWMYMAVCMFDFMLAPVLWSVLQAVFHGGINTQWQPLTLQGAGLFHVAMGAVLGIAAYGRTQEKLNGVAMGQSGPQMFGQEAGTTYIPPNSVGMVNVTSNNAAPTNFGSNNSFNNNSSASNFTNQQAFGSVGTGFSSGASAATSAPPPPFGGPAPTLTTAPPPAFGGKPSGPTQTFPAL